MKNNYCMKNHCRYAFSFYSLTNVSFIGVVTSVELGNKVVPSWVQLQVQKGKMKCQFTEESSNIFCDIKTHIDLHGKQN